MDISEADIFGVALVSAGGKILLCQPQGQFGGYAWTFPKARRLAGETPLDTAKRAALTKAGYRAELIDQLAEVFVGTTSKTSIYIAGPLDKQLALGKDTALARWVPMREAEGYIAQTTSSEGRERDLQILRTTREVFKGLPWELRPSTCKEDWITREMPEKRASILVDLSFDARGLASIRKGFFPVLQDQKWFVWCDGNTVYFHRSWSGFCIYLVDLTLTQNGAYVMSALVNRDPDQYSETDDAIDARNVAELFEHLLVNGPKVYQQDSFAAALEQLAMPNYLGSPHVVGPMLANLIEYGVGYARGEQDFNGLWDTIWNLSQEIVDGKTYTLMPSWHTPRELGSALVTYFGVKQEPIFADMLAYFLSEAFMALALKARDFEIAFRNTPNLDREKDLAPKLAALNDWAVAVFLGTNMLTHLNITLRDFEQPFAR